MGMYDAMYRMFFEKEENDFKKSVEKIVTMLCRKNMDFEDRRCLQLLALVFTSPELFFSTRRVEKNSPGLVKGETQWVISGVQAVYKNQPFSKYAIVIHGHLSAYTFCTAFTYLFARVYTYFISPKKHSPLHTREFYR